MPSHPPAARTSGAGVVAALVAMAAWAASGVISKGLEMDALAIVLYRMWLYSAAMVLAVALAREHRLDRARLRAALPGGIALGLDICLFFSAVKMTTVANATVIGALQPLLLMWAGPRLFGHSEQTSRRDLVLALMAIAGVAIVLFGSTGLPDWRPRGDVLSACALVAWTAYFVFSKRTQTTVKPLEYTAATALIATVFNTPIALLSGQDLSWPGAADWFWLGLLALGPGLLGHGLMNWSLTRIPVWFGATLSLFIPVTATLMAWLFIGEEVVAVQFVGMGVVLGALVALVLHRQRPAVPAGDASPGSAAPDTARGITMESS